MNFNASLSVCLSVAIPPALSLPLSLLPFLPPSLSHSLCSHPRLRCFYSWSHLALPSSHVPLCLSIPSPFCHFLSSSGDCSLSLPLSLCSLLKPPNISLLFLFFFLGEELGEGGGRSSRSDTGAFVWIIGHFPDNTAAGPPLFHQCESGSRFWNLFC